MGQFKPMVKMYTDEPSVILKLKKGGKVKGHAADHGHHGHKAMAHVAAGHMHGAHKAFESEHGKAPKKPSMAERRRAMNPQQYAKGGKVAHKLDGGMMGAGVPTPMGRAALMGMTPAQRMARAAMVRRALTGMKKGGHAGLEKHVEKLEKELHHHESMPMSKAHKADGGAIDKAETRTTLKGDVKKFAKDFMVTGQKHDSAHGTGDVKEGKAGGYKHGGKAHRKMCKGGKYAVGGKVPSETNESETRGKTVMGGTIEDNEHYYENTEMHSARPDKAHGTGGVSMSNAGGFKRGGKMQHKAKGGNVEKYITRDTVEGDNWENRPANTAKPGKKGTHTGEVKESNAGGFRHGGHAKKRYATGGNVIDDGKAVKYPPRIKHSAVANTMQSGTYRRGGKVHHHADGELVSANPRSVTVEKSKVTTDVPTPAQAERMRREIQEKRMDRDTNTGYDRFMKIGRAHV